MPIENARRPIIAELDARAVRPRRSLKRTRLPPGLRAESVLHGAARREALQKIERERHVAHQRRLVTQKAIAGQLQLQRLGGGRGAAAPPPVSWSPTPPALLLHLPDRTAF